MNAPEHFSRFVDLRVRFAETDAQGVVYHSNFLVYCEVARVEYFRALGGGLAALFDTARYEVLIAHAECNYRSSARFDDPLRVWTRMAALGRSSFTFEFKIVHTGDGRLICDAKTIQVAIDSQLRKSTALPRDFIDRVRAFDPAVG